MPELPEVETVRRGLAQELPGRMISGVTLRRADLRTPFPKNFANLLAGKRIQAIHRRAKYLQVELEGGQVLVIHLGMSGKLVMQTKAPKSYAKHDHVVFDFDDGRQLIFNDARRFGLMDLATTTTLDSHPLFAHLGFEPLSPDFTAKALHERLSRRQSPVKVAIMDQELVVGVGNIYASEALHQAGIHPARKAATINMEEAVRLHMAIQKVLLAAIESGGSTLRDYVRSSGDAGYFQHHFQVYDREGEPCFACKSPIENLRQAGRSTYFCASCQVMLEPAKKRRVAL